MAKEPVLAPKVTTDWAPFPAPGEVAPVVETPAVEEPVSE